jgi:hypothetical protein
MKEVIENDDDVFSNRHRKYDKYIQPRGKRTGTNTNAKKKTQPDTLTRSKPHPLPLQYLGESGPNRRRSGGHPDSPRHSHDFASFASAGKLLISRVFPTGSTLHTYHDVPKRVAVEEGPFIF